jgi:GMP synthase-like glutamine amidotransferase
MSGLILQNDTEDGPSLLGEWLDENVLPFDTIKTWSEGVPPDPDRWDWVVAMGSKCSATDQEPDWVPAEIDFLRRAVASDVPVLGICFGGQALARALDAEISPADPLSVGWFETHTHDPSVVPPGPWLHLNFERFSVPSGATLIAESPTGNDAFSLGPHLGLQFHPEATPPQVDGWVDDLAEPLGDRGVDLDALKKQGGEHGETAAQQAKKLFAAWHARASSHAERTTERL